MKFLDIFFILKAKARLIIQETNLLLIQRLDVSEELCLLNVELSEDNDIDLENFEIRLNHIHTRLSDLISQITRNFVILEHTLSKSKIFIKDTYDKRRKKSLFS
jgi:hypothetical protein